MSAGAQTTLNGSSFALKSSGTASGTGWTLSQDGYLGTYVTLNQPGPISLAINAAGSTSNGVASNLTVSIADDNQSFTLGSGTAGTVNYVSPTMPAGTYLVRAQLDNHKTVLVNNAPVAANTALTINSVTVGGNATVSNSSTDANALAAANTYIDNFRKGSATVKLVGATPGSAVHVQLTNNAFQLGTYVSGGFSSTDSYLLANPAPGSDAANFQQFVNGRFNLIEPSNAGKWQQNETFFNNGASSTVNMSSVDQMMAYAAAHGMTARQHNLIWGSQQPTQIKTWMTDAANASSPTRAQSLASVKTAIANRIAYYIQGTNSVDRNVRAADFQQLDVLNEALLTGNYYSVLGVSGVADVYRQAQAAVAAVGAHTRLYTNEYNVLQNSPGTVTFSSTYGAGATATGSDAYANWYRNEVEGLNNAALTAGASGNVVTGIGVQYYPTGTSNKGPAIIQQAMQNLSVEALPISLTEFGGQTSVTASAAPQLIDDTIRMMMGTPAVDTMNIWGWYDDGNASTNQFGGGTVLVNKGWKNADGSWNLTAAGKRFEYLFGRGLDPTAPGNVNGVNPDPLTTDLLATVSPDGTINFNGFYGDYELTIGGQTYDLTLTKGGVSSFTIAVPEPTSAGLLIGSGILWLRCRRRL
jgi:GH35 family endo-1,4-beta-xylanase